MSTTPHAGPPVQDPPSSGSPSRLRRKNEASPRRSWFIDDIVVIVFALFGFAGGVFLPHFMQMPAITTSFLLATGMAALTYRFLGGIQGASFTVGSLKLGGALAALVGIAMLINHTMVAETTPTTTSTATPAHRAYHVTGTVVDNNGAPISNLAISDFIVSPPGINPGLGGRFSVTFANGLDFNGQPQFPTLTVSHGVLSSDPMTLKPSAPSDLEIALGTIRLHSAAAAPAQGSTPHSSAEQTEPLAASLTPGPERRP